MHIWFTGLGGSFSVQVILYFHIIIFYFTSDFSRKCKNFTAYSFKLFDNQTYCILYQKKLHEKKDRQVDWCRVKVHLQTKSHRNEARVRKEARLSFFLSIF